MAMIDPRIALSYQQPDIPDPQVTRARAQNYDTVENAQALQKADLTGVNLQNQERQKALDNQTALNAAISQNTKPDPITGAPVIDHSAVAAALLKSGKGVLAQSYQSNVTAIDKANTDLKAAQEKLDADKHAHLAQLVGTVIDAPPEARPFVYQSALKYALQNQYAQPGELPAQYNPSLDPQLASLRDSAQTVTEQHTAKLADQTAAETKRTNDAKIAADNAKQLETDVANAAQALGNTRDQAGYAAVYNGLKPELQARFTAPAQFTPQTPAAALHAGLTPEQVTTADATRSRDAATAADRAATHAFQNAELKIRADQADVARAAADPWGILGLNKHPMGAGGGGAPGASAAHGDAFLQTLPAQFASTVKAVAEGRQTNLPRGGKELDQLMGAVNQYDPSYSVQRAQTRTAFNTGKQGQNIGNLNTAVVHLDQYHEAMKAMNNGSFQPGNQLYNFLAEKFGSDKVTNPAFVRQALAGEAANALKGNATDPEIAGLMKTLGQNQSSAQQEGVALEGLRILGTKLNTYDEQYHTQFNADDPWSPVLPTAKAVFARYGITPLTRDAGTTPASPAGSASKPQKLAPAFKKIAYGPNGQQIGSNDEKTWFDLTTGKKYSY